MAILLDPDFCLRYVGALSPLVMPMILIRPRYINNLPKVLQDWYTQNEFLRKIDTGEATATSVEVSSWEDWWEERTD